MCKYENKCLNLEIVEFASQPGKKYLITLVGVAVKCTFIMLNQLYNETKEGYNLPHVLHNTIARGKGRSRKGWGGEMTQK